MKPIWPTRRSDHIQCFYNSCDISGLGLVVSGLGLGLTIFFWPRPHSIWPRHRPHSSLASLTSLTSSSYIVRFQCKSTVCCSGSTLPSVASDLVLPSSFLLLIFPFVTHLLLNIGWLVSAWVFLVKLADSFIGWSDVVAMKSLNS